MSDTICITLAQLNPTLGDIAGNIDKIKATRDQATDDTDLIVYSEQVVTGYPQEDLVLKPFFLRRVMVAVEELAKTTTKGPALLISAPRPRPAMSDRASGWVQ